MDSPGFQQQQLLQHASIINDPSIVDEKDVILAAQETHEYYSESDDSVDFNPVQQKSKSAKKKTLTKKSRTQAKESTTTTTFQKPASGKDIKKTATVLDYLDHYHLAKSKRRSSQNKSALLALWYVICI